MKIRDDIRIAAIACILFCFALGCSPGAEETLRVLSYNIHMWEPSVKVLTGVIKSADPDIVGLNEAWTEKHNGEIAKALGYNMVCGGQGVPGIYFSAIERKGEVTNRKLVSVR